MSGPSGAPSGAFERVLVANRGEIACRVLHTLRRMGIGTVAVYSDADLGSPHVAMADRAVRLGPGPARESYLDLDALLSAVRGSGAQAVHPGYGFLSESAELAAALEREGVTFIGPTPEQLRVFGQKHLARDAAAAAGVPLLAGSGLLGSLDEALERASEVGYPVMLKAVAGGGGIGMTVCDDAASLRDSFERVQRLGEANFGSGGVFLERYVARARHVEVQVFGDGEGDAVTLGERDCSLQRRNQKVFEETPAAGLPGEVRTLLHDAARELAASVRYRSAGTVEFLVDADRFDVSFLEVNARLQVEHPVTEAVWGVDLVEWMVRLAAGDADLLERWRASDPQPRGHAIEARLYAEDAARDHRPSAGVLTRVVFPDDASRFEPAPVGEAGAAPRVDTWVSTGTEVTPLYDPLLAKVIALGTDREEAADRLSDALARTHLDGLETNLGLLRSVLGTPLLRAVPATTADLDAVPVPSPTIEVLEPGTMTTVQDHPGRLGHWDVGVPPSGPMDDLSFRLANRALGNPPSAAGLELTLSGPTLRFREGAVACLAGAPMPVTLDGVEVQYWRPFAVPAGGVLAIGTGSGPGLRAYLAVRGGLDVPTYLGSAATFTLGGFGGLGGRALRSGDVLRVAPVAAGSTDPAPVPEADRPTLTSAWELQVTIGPHGAPDFFTREDVDRVLAAEWKVHHNSSRTGVRLVGPKPTWARPDGGEAGLHPSNIHDTPYAVGSVDFTGDMPILLGPDGPSLGGFVCPAVVCEAERWKLGQLRPGDTVHLVAVDAARAAELRRRRDAAVGASADDGGAPAGDDGATAPTPTVPPVGAAVPDGVLHREPPSHDRHELVLRRAGDDNLLVEYGPMVLDLEVRLRVHTLHRWLEARRIPGIVDLTAGIRSLQLHVDPSVLSVERAADLVLEAQDELPRTDEIEVPSRVVHLPLSWDDPATREAIERYMTSVRDDAPWCPWNIEFIRRINGLASTDDVRRTVFDASYLVLGLGDVYLGAPVATPLDPRHRLVTTKYNPARTWTPENAVGIGGAYLCIYGMEGPGGYQFVGRTLQVWNRYGRTGPFEGEERWLLRLFDQIRWYPVEADELLEMRAAFPHGRVEVEVEETTFRLADHRRTLESEAASIEAFRSRQQAAFAAERTAWRAAGEFDRTDDEPAPVAAGGAADDVGAGPGESVVRSPMAANVWRVEVEEGQVVEPGQVLVVLEAMKTETPVAATAAGTVRRVVAAPGTLVEAGSALVVIADA
ncbi:urea carboxylase [Dermatobacter hominis]|uniref:urea carboxylase n=1 Tax=Dermatobacter hominis TaxID=2884263 RepID=UPI001D128D13|nr:urea carboxylase [Dermatobacter hominis]UDY35284.1 urea carboxylase [Dermatobacter hominis]